MATSLWAEELKQSITSVQGLQAAGLLSALEEQELTPLGDRFKIRITPYYAQLMKGDSTGAIRAQSMPSTAENDPTLPAWAETLSQEIYGRPTPWHNDAIGDIERLAAPRLTHRYQNRAILHVSSLCAMYCRFCFRKGHLNDQDRVLYDGSLDAAFDYIANTSSLSEIILTGGDPLSISDEALSKILDRLDAIEHVRTIRIHSRMAVTLPSRFTNELIEILGNQRRRARVVLVSHFNHSCELTAKARTALDHLRRAGVVLLNQAVLLRAVNDNASELLNLFQGLYESGVIPYYLHHPDWTPGTFHFRVSIARGREIYQSLRGQLSGPALPQYILDIPQGLGKIAANDFNLRKIHTESDHQFTADIYELLRPQTLVVPDQKPIKYLDLYPSNA